MMRTTNIMAMSAAAVLLMASCSKDQVTQTNPGDGIRFNALTGSATKATETTTDNLNSFKVHASAQTTSSLDFVETYTGSNSSWTPGSGALHYWPSSKTENMTFHAYSPADFLTSYGVNQEPTAEYGTALSFANVTVPIHSADQKDLVFARYQGTHEQNTSGAVSLKFQHAFAQLALKASCGDANMRVTVYGAKIYGLKGTSTFTFPTTNTELYTTTADNTDDITANLWNTPSDGQKVTYMMGGTDKNGVQVTSDNGVQDIANGDGTFMVIPQNLSPAWNPSNDVNNNSQGGYIAVLCKIETKVTGADGESWEQIFPATTTMKAGFAAVPITQNFQRNRKYTITLQFFYNGGGGGVIPPDKTDPTVQPGPDPDIDTGGNPGDPILAPMSFTVAVSDWTPVSDINTPMGAPDPTASQVRQ